MDHHIEEAELHSLLSNAVEKMVNRVLRASRRNSGLSKEPLSIAEIISRMESPVETSEAKDTFFKRDTMKLLTTLQLAGHAML
jgi:hypothetical protein